MDSEIESYRNRIYNMSLYLSYIERKHPLLFSRLLKRFNGMPGYAGEVDL